MNSAWSAQHRVYELPTRTTLGVQLRHDQIMDVGLGLSRARCLLGTVHSRSTTVVNLRGGWHITNTLDMAIDVFNLFDSHDADISYFFASCLPSDPVDQCGAGLPTRDGVEDVHVRPVEPRSIRATLTLRF